jgi:hypothetical protein
MKGHRLRAAKSATLLLIVSACAPPPERTPDAFRLVATVGEVMRAITVPASDAVWRAGADPPETADQWVAIEHAALALAESGNLLLMEGRAADRGNWEAQALAMIEAARAAALSARDRDLDRLLDSGDAIYLTCEGCHADYMITPP